MSGRFEGKALIVTGSTGIGAAAARLARAEGAHVLVASRDEESDDGGLMPCGLFEDGVEAGIRGYGSAWRGAGGRRPTSRDTAPTPTSSGLPSGDSGASGRPT